MVKSYMHSLAPDWLSFYGRLFWIRLMHSDETHACIWMSNSQCKTCTGRTIFKEHTHEKWQTWASMMNWFTGGVRVINHIIWPKLQEHFTMKSCVKLRAWRVGSWNLHANDPQNWPQVFITATDNLCIHVLTDGIEFKVRQCNACVSLDECFKALPCPYLWWIIRVQAYN